MEAGDAQGNGERKTARLAPALMALNLVFDSLAAFVALGRSRRLPTTP